MQHLFNNLQQHYSEQRGRFFLWTPACLMLGIFLFFSLPSDPPAILAPLILFPSLFLAFITRKSPLRHCFIPLFLIILGYAASQFRVQSTATHLITQELHYRDVQGKVELAEPSNAKVALTLSHLTIEGLTQAQTPDLIRITLRGAQPNFDAGSIVHLKANIYPLPAPTMLGGFDFALYYYFNRVGGTGYSLSPAEVTTPAIIQSWNMAINNLRHNIGQDMRDGMSEPAGAVAAAMTISETTPIPKYVNNDLRDSGLYHILSISGFHLAVVTGMVFGAMRLILSLIPALALRINTKKIAGLLALLAAFAYLALAGYPIPAQRSFIMVAFVFIAILCDRRGISLRSMAFAATALLLFFPESLYSASFQLSFAATLAIVSLAENWIMPKAQTIHGRVVSHLFAILISSLATSLATAPFIIYDFNRLSIMGVFSNMIVLPLASAVIMPAIIVAMLIMPFGLQWLAYIPLQWGTNLMLKIAAYAAAMPLASIRLYALSEAGVILAAIGLLWFCLWRGRLRLWGIPMLLISLATMSQHRPVDVFISAGANQVIVRLENGHYTALKGTSRAYAVQSWLQSEGQGDVIPLKESDITCDLNTCSYTKNAHTLIMVTHPERDTVLDKACKAAPDILIAARYLKAARCPGPKILIGKNELNAYGPHALYLTPAGVEVTRTHEPGVPLRQWQPSDNEGIEE